MALGLLDVERPDLAATTTLEAVGPWRVVHVPAAPGGGPGYPDRSVEIVAALFPATNEEAPSATDSAFLSLTP